MATFLLKRIGLEHKAGFGAAAFVRWYQAWPTLIDPNAVIIAFAFAGAVGVFFGFYPARKAAALDPIEALRFE